MSQACGLFLIGGEAEPFEKEREHVSRRTDERDQCAWKALVEGDGLCFFVAVAADGVIGCPRQVHDLGVLDIGRSRVAETVSDFDRQG